MSHPPGGPPDAAPTEAVPEEPWQRLDARMLLVHPVREVIRFIPALIGIFLAGSTTDRGELWQALGIAVPIALGLLRYLTTSFRIAGGRVELRHGLLNRHVTAARLDRVRTVDVTASPIHRLLGLTTVRIGTGSTSRLQDDGLDLDGLPSERARDLRQRLLHSISPSTEVQDGPEQAAARVVVAFEPRWLRYAPFTSTGLVMAAAVVGFGSQVISGLDLWDSLDLEGAGHDAAVLPVWLVLPMLAVGVTVGVLVLSVLGYLVTNGNFTLTHTRTDGSWHLRRGLLTTRETSLDDDRVRGVAIGEPAGLRLARGARLSAVATGLDRQERGSSTLVPPAPREVVDRVAAEVLGSDAPVTVALRGHGPRAVRRRWTRALLPAAPVVAATVVLAAVGSAVQSAWWAAAGLAVLAAACALATDRALGLGHALVEGHLVARSGSLTRRREMLGTDAVIGWNLRSTWWQRRAGLVTLVATTAGGAQHVDVLDVPTQEAVELAEAAVPGLVTPFVEH